MGITRIFNPAYEASKGFTWLQLKRMSPATKQFFADAKGQVEGLQQDVTAFVNRNSRGKAIQALEKAKADTRAWATRIENTVADDLDNVGGYGDAHIEDVAEIAKQAAMDNMHATQTPNGIRTAIDQAWDNWIAEAPIDQNVTKDAIKARLKRDYNANPTINDDTFVDDIADQVQHGWDAGENEPTIRGRIHRHLNGKGVDGDQDDIADLVEEILNDQKQAAENVRQDVVDNADANLNAQIGTNFAQLQASHGASDLAETARVADSNELGPKVTTKASVPISRSTKAGREALSVKVATPDGGSVEATLPKRKPNQSAQDYMGEQRPRIERLIGLQDRSHTTGQVSKKFFRQGGSELTDAGMERHDEALQFFEDGTRSAELATMKASPDQLEMKVYGRKNPNGADQLKVSTSRNRWGLGGFVGKESKKVELANEPLNNALGRGKAYTEAFRTDDRKLVSPELMTDGHGRLSDPASKRYTGIKTALTTKAGDLTTLEGEGITVKAKRSSKGPKLRITHETMNGGNPVKNFFMDKKRHLHLQDSGNNNYNESVARAVDYAKRLTTERHDAINPKMMRNRGNKAVTQAGIDSFDDAKRALDRTGKTQTDIQTLENQGIFLRVRGNGDIQITHKKGNGRVSNFFRTSTTNLKKGTDDWNAFVDRAITEGQKIAQRATSSSSGGI